FSGDGTKLFAGYQDGTVSMWSTTDWHPTTLNERPRTAEPSLGGNEAPGKTSTTRPQSAVRSITVSFDGRYIVVATDDATRLWNTATRENEVLDYSNEGVMHIARDGTAVVRTYHNRSELYYRYGGYQNWNIPEVSQKCWANAATDQGNQQYTTRMAMSGD